MSEPTRGAATEPSRARRPVRWPEATLMTVLLAALGLWCLNTQLSAGIGVESATLAITAVLACAGRVTAHVVGSPGRPGAEHGRLGDEDESR